MSIRHSKLTPVHDFGLKLGCFVPFHVTDAIDLDGFDAMLAGAAPEEGEGQTFQVRCVQVDSFDSGEMMVIVLFISVGEYRTFPCGIEVFSEFFHTIVGPLKFVSLVILECFDPDVVTSFLVVSASTFLIATENQVASVIRAVRIFSLPFWRLVPSVVFTCYFVWHPFELWLSVIRREINGTNHVGRRTISELSKLLADSAVNRPVLFLVGARTVSNVFAAGTGFGWAWMVMKHAGVLTRSIWARADGTKFLQFAHYAG